jgi:hypothetical protein
VGTVDGAVFCIVNGGQHSPQVNAAGAGHMIGEHLPTARRAQRIMLQIGVLLPA